MRQESGCAGQIAGSLAIIAALEELQTIWGLYHADGQTDPDARAEASRRLAQWLTEHGLLNSWDRRHLDRQWQQYIPYRRNEVYDPVTLSLQFLEACPEWLGPKQFLEMASKQYPGLVRQMGLTRGGDRRGLKPRERAMERWLTGRTVESGWSGSLGDYVANNYVVLQVAAESELGLSRERFRSICGGLLAKLRLWQQVSIEDSPALQLAAPAPCEPELDTVELWLEMKERLFSVAAKLKLVRPKQVDLIRRLLDMRVSCEAVRDRDVPWNAVGDELGIKPGTAQKIFSRFCTRLERALRARGWTYRDLVYDESKRVAAQLEHSDGEA